VPKQRINDIMDSKPGAIEKALFELRPILARRNRSILSYRFGEESEVLEEGQPKPGHVSSVLVQDTGRSRALLVKPVEKKIVVEETKPPRVRRHIPVLQSGRNQKPAPMSVQQKNVVELKEAKPTRGRGHTVVDESAKNKQAPTKPIDEKISSNLTLSITVDSNKVAELADLKNRNTSTSSTGQKTTEPLHSNEVSIPELRRQLKSPPSPSASHGFEEQVLFNTNRSEMENAENGDNTAGSRGGLLETFFGLL